MALKELQVSSKNVHPSVALGCQVQTQRPTTPHGQTYLSTMLETLALVRDRAYRVTTTPVLTVRMEAHMPRVRYWRGETLAHVLTLHPLWVPTPGFQLAAPDQPVCAECRGLADQYLERGHWLGPYDPSYLCQTCLRSPVEYLLGHVPDHAIWFERSVRAAASNERAAR